MNGAKKLQCITPDNKLWRYNDGIASRHNRDRGKAQARHWHSGTSSLSSTMVDARALGVSLRDASLRNAFSLVIKTSDQFLGCAALLVNSVQSLRRYSIVSEYELFTNVGSQCLPPSAGFSGG